MEISVGNGRYRGRGRRDEEKESNNDGATRGPNDVTRNEKRKMLIHRTKIKASPHKNLYLLYR